jgi:hypothetical protein
VAAEPADWGEGHLAVGPELAGVVAVDADLVEEGSVAVAEGLEAAETAGAAVAVADLVVENLVVEGALVEEGSVVVVGVGEAA